MQVMQPPNIVTRRISTAHQRVEFGIRRLSSPHIRNDRGIFVEKPSKFPSPLQQSANLSSGWSDEIVPVPSGLLTKTDSQSLQRLLNQGVESYLYQLRQPPVHGLYDNFKPPKPSPRMSGSVHYRPPNLGRAALEDWMRKHRRKSSSAKSSYNIAFGRSNCAGYARRRSNSTVADQITGTSGSFLKCLRGKLNARREVLNAIQDYHINSQARAQLEKRADEIERERKERQRQKAAADRERRKSRQILINNSARQFHS